MKKKLLFIIILFSALCFSVNLYAENLTIYCEDDPPMQLKDANGKLTGMTVEIVQEIQKRVGNTDPIQMVPWARGLSEAQKTPNVVLFSMGRTAERNPLFQWACGPISESVFSLYVKADSKISIKSLDDAKKLKNIGVYINDVRDAFLTKEGFTNLERVNNNTVNFKKLMAGRIDAYASGVNSITDEAAAAGYKAEDVKNAFDFLKVQIYIIMSKGTPENIVKTWSDAFASMQTDGSFATIYKKYYPTRSLPGPAITNF